MGTWRGDIGRRSSIDERSRSNELPAVVKYGSTPTKVAPICGANERYLELEKSFAPRSEKDDAQLPTPRTC